MKITFLLPQVKLSGGVKVVFEYANHLYDRGHCVSVVYPFIPMKSGKKWHDLRYLTGMGKQSVVNAFRGVYVDWFDLKADIIRVPTFSEKYIPNADVIVATWWETSYYMVKYHKNKGEKFYLIQSYEIWGGPKAKVDKTYQLGLHNIVISSWLRNVMKQLGSNVDGLILNGVNLNEFYPEEIEKNDNEIRILMPYRRGEWKGVRDGLEAFEIVRRKYSNARLIMFGSNPRKNELPKDVEFHLRLTKDKVRKIYNSCDIFCFPSHMEGFGLPPIEAMACRIPVVATNVGAVSDFAIHGTTALISEPKDVQAMSQNIIELIKDKHKRQQIAEAGHEYIKQFTWDKAVDKMERIFQRYIEK